MFDYIIKKADPARGSGGWVESNLAGQQFDYNIYLYKKVQIIINQTLTLKVIKLL